MDSLRVGRPFVPFSIRVAEDGTSTLQWFVDAPEERAVARARHEVATSRCVRYAVALVEQIRDRQGTRRPAVVVEVGGRTSEQALRMGQPYEPFGGLDAPLRALGSPIMLGDTTNVLRGSALDPGKPAAFVAVCPKCSQRNRVSLARVRERLPKCGACSESLVST